MRIENSIGTSLPDVSLPSRLNAGLLSLFKNRLIYMHCPKSTHKMIKTIIVPKQPPPNFLAP
jgi:hypothetical protein